MSYQLTFTCHIIFGIMIAGVIKRRLNVGDVVCQGSQLPFSLTD